MRSSGVVVPILLAGCVAVLAQSDFAFRIAWIDSEPSGDLRLVLESTDLSAFTSHAWKTEDFRLVEDNRPTIAPDRVQTYDEFGGGVATVIAVDVSGSMRGKPLQEAAEAVSTFSETIGEKDRVALISFSNEVQLHLGFTNDAAAVAGAVTSLQVRTGRTYLHDALIRTIAMLNESGLPRRRRVFVISDSHDLGSRQTYEQVLEQARSSNVVVDALIRTAGGPGFEHALGRLTDRTGGFFASDPGQSSAAVKTMVHRIRSTPVLRFSRTVQSDAKTASIGLLMGGAMGVPPVTAAIPRTRIDRGTPRWPLPVALLTLAIIGGVIVYFVVRRRKRSEPTVEQSSILELPHGRKRRDTAILDVDVFEFRPTQPGGPFAILEFENGPRHGRRILLSKNSFLIGASDINDLPIPEDEFASSEHARLLYESGTLRAVDSESRNGTFVNDERISHEGTILRPGDLITIGATRLRVMVAHPEQTERQEGVSIR